MSEPEWSDALAAGDLPDDNVRGVVVAGREIALYRVAGEVFASDGMCTHGLARLCDGFLEGHEIECPLHQGRFDVRDGFPTCAPPDEPLRVYPVSIEGGRIRIALGSSAD